MGKISCALGILCSIVNGANPETEKAMLKKNIDRLEPVTITANTKHLSPGDKKALDAVIAAARILDPLFLEQVWSGNPDLAEKLKKDSSDLGKLRWDYFQINVGPWSRLDKGEAFIEGVPSARPHQAGFYPEDMTKEEFESWVKTLPAKEKEVAIGFFTVLVRENGRLKQVPYSEHYKRFLEPAAALLKKAASHTTNASLKKYLNARAGAFGSNNYYDSDVAWMELDSPIEVTIGPYETYEDELLNYKAAFEAFVTLRNDAETKKLSKLGGYLQEIENTLPVDPKYRNPKIGAASPIRVVDEVFTSGDARRGVATAAFNLPNDEKVIKEKGSKRVMLRNVQQMKFDKVLAPISKKTLSKKNQKLVKFDAFFTHILMHELMHGLGPHDIKIDGRETTVRHELKELSSALEEAKADIMGLWAMRYLINKGVLPISLSETMYDTYLASCFRSVRFGINEAHGKGIALQFNYLWDEGAIGWDEKTGIFHPVLDRIGAAAEKLTREILTIQAEGSYARAKALLEKFAVVRSPMQRALDGFEGIPVDIRPRFPIAGE